MLWKTHIAISNQALKIVGISLSYEVLSKFKDGIIAPDQWKDYPHHYGKSKTIAANLLRARDYHLRDDLPSTFYYLGVALHYIQDAYTSVISYNSPRNYEWHQNYEQSIENTPFVSNIEDNIQYYFRTDYSQLNKYLAIARQLSSNVEGKNPTLALATLVGEYQSTQTGKPIIDRNLALMASVAVIRSVISSTNNSRIDDALKQYHRNYENLLREAEISTSNKILVMANQVEQLKNRRTPDSRLIARLKNGLLTLRVNFREWRLGSEYSKYLETRHLLAVSRRYKEATDSIMNSEIGWYNFSRPELNLKIVERDLVPLQSLGISFAVPYHNIGKLRIVSRREVN